MKKNEKDEVVETTKEDNTAPKKEKKKRENKQKEKKDKKSSKEKEAVEKKPKKKSKNAKSNDKEESKIEKLDETEVLENEIPTEIVEKDKNKKKKKKDKKKFHIHLSTIGIFLLDIVVVAVLIVINTEQFKTFWIPTAMTTMNHKYLAYTLYNEETVNKIMSENYIEQNTDEVNLDDVVIGDLSKKTHFVSKYEEDLYTKVPGNDIYKVIRIDEPKYKGYLTAIYDPADVELAVPQKLGKMGESVNTMCKKNGGLVGINGGGFEDLDGWGNGSIPYGAIIKDGQLIWQHSGGSGQLIGFTKDHKLWLTGESPQVAISKGMVDAVEFGPNLIVNGKVSKIHGDGGWGTAPRSVIAQRRDGIVLFLIIEGRLPGYSIGATMNDVIEMLLRYGAYNAANLDGGASCTMSLNGKLHNRPSAGGEYGGRTVSNAWIVTNKNGKQCNGCVSSR